MVLIMADDIGQECFGCYGGQSYQTPVIDELARTGIRFDHCYSQPLCTPSRVQIMTGQYNHRNYTEFGVLDPGQKTFGHLMQKAGYTTCVVGKWQLYGSVDQRPAVRGTGTYPTDAGFDEFCLWQIEQRGERFKNPMIVRNGQTRTDLKGRYGPDVFTDYALGFMERNRDKPFFVYFPMALVHSPFVPTPDGPDWDLPKHKSDPKYFAEMVAYMDKIVGRFVSQLDELGLREKTLVLFTGDNGTHKAITSKINGRTVTGAKGETTDAGTHVPFVANWKGVTQVGRACDDLIDFSDFYPTLAELAGAALPSDSAIDGRSFLPQLRGQRGHPREWVYCYYNPKWLGREEPTAFARDKRWKLYGDGRLYDVPADPLEEKPVESGRPGAQAARGRLQAVLDSMK